MGGRRATSERGAAPERGAAHAAALPRPVPVTSGLPDAVLRPVREGNAFESTVEYLATAIRLGVFAAGERLPPERELAERLRVGRATLREAIGALRQAGLVTTRRGRGGGSVVVYRGPHADAAGPERLPCTSAELTDLLTFRQVVEPGAVALAAAADLTAQQRGWLVEALQAVTEATADGPRRVADSRLHLALASLSASPMLLEAVTQAQARLVEVLAAIPVLGANIAHSDTQHAEVVDAVLSGDAGRARTVMEQHCEATSALLRGLIG